MRKASLNHAYRLVWSDLHQAFIAVAEYARSRSKGGHRAVTLLTTALLLSGAVQAADLPSGGLVVAGSGSISQSGNTMTINQSSSKLAVDWQSFNIGQGHTVNFVQPSASAVALNRVLGSDVSVIQGALNANGQVFLINPNGVLFTPTAQVNVGGIVASTLNLSNANFMAGNYQFEGGSSNAIINQGNIKVGAGGTAALIAAKITHTGNIDAPHGNVLMGAGNKVTLDFGGPVKIEVTQGALDALIEQGGAIKADGGLIYLTAKAANLLTTTVINHTGITEAQTLATGETGEIYLMGGMTKDRIAVGGTLKAEGGFIETSAAKLKLADGAQIRAGHWLIDPTDFTVDAAVASTLQGQLGSGDATVTTAGAGSDAGDIFVNSGITWNSGNTLTLRADRNIEINASIDASEGSGGKLALQYGQGASVAGNTATYTIRAPISLQSSGAADGNNGATPTNFSTKLGFNGPAINYTVVNSQGDLQAMSLTGNYALGSMIDFSGYWTPIGTGGNDCTTAFCGKFDGLGNTIGYMTIESTGEVSGDGVGFFAATKGASIQNLYLTRASVYADGAYFSSPPAVGTVIGRQVDSVLHNVHVTNSSLTAYNAESAGGLVGALGTSGGNGPDSLISDSSANMWVSGTLMVGGLVGQVHQGGRILNSAAAGAVTANFVDNSSTYYAGGLVGSNDGQIENAYAIGSVTMSDGPYDGWLGGLVGRNFVNGSISGAYATGAVSAESAELGLGGLVGVNQGVITKAYWDNVTTKQVLAFGHNFNPGTANAIPLSQETNNAYTRSEYVDFDFTKTWWMVDGATRPFLRSEWRSIINNAHHLQLIGMQPALGYTMADSIDLRTVLTNQSEMWKGETVDSTFQGNWSPIGNADNPFSGTLNGQYSTIGNLYIRADNADKNYGLFDTVRDGTVTRLRLVDGSVTYTGDSSTPAVGALAGKVVGSSTLYKITTSNLSIEGNDYIGGLIGFAGGDSESGIVTISNSGTAGTVVARGNVVGGLIGVVSGNTLVTASYANSSVSAIGSYVGGLIGGIGDNGPASVTVSQSYATGAVSGDESIGGLIGAVAFENPSSTASITNTYARGAVNGVSGGGLVGALSAQATVDKSYAVGSAGDGFGGLIGQNEKADFTNVTTSYWDKETTGKTTSAGGMSKTTAQMKSLPTFGGWEMVEDSSIPFGSAYPQLRWKATGVDAGTSVWVIGPSGTAVTYTFGALSGTYTYNGNPYSLTNLWSAESLFGASYNSWALGTDYIFKQGGSTVTSFTNAGTYSNITVDILKSGFIAASSGNTAGNLIITPAPLTVSADAKSKTYGAADPALTYSITAGQLFGSDSLSGGLSRVAGNNVGTYVIQQNNLTNSNYAITYNGANLTIDPKVLNITGLSAQNKVYDGSVSASISGTPTLNGLIEGDTVTMTGTAAGQFANANVGNAKQVSVTGLSLDGTHADNYTVGAPAGLTADITARPITVTADAKSKVYGNTDPTLTYAIVAGNLVEGDSLTGALTRTAGENIGSYTIDASALANGNYLITATNGTLTISPRPITVTADAKSKVYGNTDPTLTYAITVGNLVEGDSLSGALMRTAGENVGSYTIDASALANGNYLITATNGTLTISPRPLGVTADNKSKTSGQSDPSLTWQLTNGSTLLGDDTLAGSLDRASGETAGTYSIGQGTLANNNYFISFIDGILTINPAVTDNPAITVAQAVALPPPMVVPLSVMPSPQLPGNFGGLAFVNIPGESGGGTGSSGNSTSSDSSGAAAQGIPANVGAGRDPSGFMKVFVVAGGINLGGRLNAAGNTTNDDAASFRSGN